MIAIDIKDTVKRIFTDFLEKRGLRKTPERYAILDEIYDGQGTFDIEALSIVLQRKNFHISKATLYNTIDLLAECNLILRQQNKGLARFEKAYQCIQHDYLVCTHCGGVIEFCDPRIEEINSTAAHLNNFEVSHYSLYIYGLCEKCRKEKESNEATVNYYENKPEL